jgi:uncharacterized protein YkwD
MAAAGETAPLKVSEQEKKFLDLTNLERKKKDLPPLKANPLLFKAARAHSENMARQRKKDHNLDGKTPLDRMTAAGYKYETGAENLAGADTGITAEEVVKAWMDSESHRDNILYDKFTETGLGLAKDKDGHVYITQLFAKPLP